MNEYMKETNEALLHTYNQFPVVLERGTYGVYRILNHFKAVTRDG